MGCSSHVLFCTVQTLVLVSVICHRLFATVLPRMLARTSYGKAVCPSVCQTRGL